MSEVQYEVPQTVVKSDSLTKSEIDSSSSDEVVYFGEMTPLEREAKMKSLVEGRKFIVIDVGPGFDPPLLSIDQLQRDLWIGVDNTPVEKKFTKANKGRCKTLPGSKRVFCPSTDIDEVPEVKADLIMMVAPNPLNIIEDGLLYKLEKFLKVGTKIYIKQGNVMDEDRRYRKEAKKMINAFLFGNGFMDNDIDIGNRSIDTSTSKNSIGGLITVGEKIR